MRHSLIRAAFALLSLLLPVVASAAVELKPDSALEFVADPSMGDTGPRTVALLERCLLQRLGKADRTGTGPPVRFVLSCQAVVWQELPAQSLRDLSELEEVSVTVEPQPPATVRIHGRTALATAFGVMDFLETDAGITWLFPGPLGVDVPPPGVITLKPGSRTSRTPYASRIWTGMLYRDPAEAHTPEGPLREGRIFYSSFDYFKSLRLNSPIGASHNMAYLFPPATTPAEHPEVMPIVKGQRLELPPLDTRGGQAYAWHPCYSNPQTTRIAIAKVKEAFAGGAMSMSLGINDGYLKRCECEACAKTGWPQAYYQWVAAVANAVLDQYPPRLIGVLGYGDVGTPPPDLKLPPNVLVLTTLPAGREGRLITWSNHAQHLGAYEYLYGAGYWYPNVSFEAMRRNEEAYRQVGLASVQGEAYPLWAFDGPKMFVRNHLMWEPRQDVDVLLDRYCSAAFGDAGPTIKQYFLRWARENDARLKPGINSLSRWRHWRDAVEQFGDLSPTVFDDCDRLLSQARALTLTDPQRRRLEMLEAFHEFSLNCMKTLRASDAVLSTAPGPDNVQALRTLMQLQQRRMDLLARFDEHPEWFVGSSVDSARIRSTYADGREWVLPRVAEAARNVGLLNAQEAGLPLDAGGDDVPPCLRGRAAPTRVPQQIHSRLAHPWYPPPRYGVMDNAAQDKHVLQLTSTAPQLDPDTGEYREQYTGASTPLLVAQPTRYVLMEFTVQGHGGVLRSLAINGSDNFAIAQFAHRVALGDKPEPRTYRVLLRPTALDGKKMIVHPDPPPGAQAMFEYFWRWQPLSPEAQCTVTVKAHLLDYPAAAAIP
jgi:hypothetical protein